MTITARLKKLLIGVLGVCSAVQVGAQAPGVLSGAGSVYIDGSHLDTPTAPVIKGDVVQTRADGTANLSFVGSSATIEPNSIIRMQENGLSLDRGGLLVASGHQMNVFARDLEITPTSTSWTQFYVTRANGSIMILARKNNVVVSCGTGSPTTIKEGQQISRLDSGDCGLADRGTGARPAATGPIIAGRTAAVVAAGAGGILAGLELKHSDDPVSPYKP
jgi:hypothetical protein